MPQIDTIISDSVKRLDSSKNNLIDSAITNSNHVLESNTLDSILKELGLVFVIISILIALILILNKLLRLAKIKLIRFFESKLNNLHHRGLKFFSPKYAITLITNTINFIRFFSIIILVYLSLPLLFSLFPWTEPISRELLSAIINPVKNILSTFLHYIPNILTIVVIYLFTRYLVKFIRFLAAEIESENIKIDGFYADWAMPTYNIIRSLLYVFMFVVIFPYLPGSDSKVFQGISVFLGVLISLGSSSAISNIVAGIVITYMRPYQIGDVVLINNNLGEVLGKNLLVTRIKTFKNEDITIPNSTILNSSTTNYTLAAKEENLILHTTVTIGYDTDWKIIHDLLINAAKISNGVCKKREPFVLQTALNDFYVSYQINAYVDNTQLPNIYSELHKNIQDKFNEAGVEIMSPHYSSLRDGNTTAIPSSYLPNDYKAPGFKIDK